MGNLSLVAKAVLLSLSSFLLCGIMRFFVGVVLVGGGTQGSELRRECGRGLMCCSLSWGL
jgi:hypothetical protein